MQLPALRHCFSAFIMVARMTKITEAVGLRFLLWNSFCHAISCNTCPTENFSPWCPHTWDSIFHISHNPTSLHHFVLCCLELLSLPLSPLFTLSISITSCSIATRCVLRRRGSQRRAAAGWQADKLVRWMGGHVEARRTCRHAGPGYPPGERDGETDTRLTGR